VCMVGVHSMYELTKCGAFWCGVCWCNSLQGVVCVGVIVCRVWSVLV
jgi:hypothetical protein